MAKVGRFAMLLRGIIIASFHDGDLVLTSELLKQGSEIVQLCADVMALTGARIKTRVVSRGRDCLASDNRIQPQPGCRVVKRGPDLRFQPDRNDKDLAKQLCEHSLSTCHQLGKLKSTYEDLVLLLAVLCQRSPVGSREIRIHPGWVTRRQRTGQTIPERWLHSSKPFRPIIKGRCLDGCDWWESDDFWRAYPNPPPHDRTGDDGADGGGRENGGANTVRLG